MVRDTDEAEGEDHQMNGMPIVYVVQEPRYRDTDGSWKTVNMLPALDFGKLEALLDAGQQVSVLNTASVVRQLKAGLAKYTDEDYLLLAGDPVAIGIACSIVAAHTRGKYTLLKWDRQERRYYPVHVNLMEG